MLRYVLEVIALLIWIGGVVMTGLVSGFMRQDGLHAMLLPIVIYGFLPIAVSAALFAFADRKLRPTWRTLTYVFAPWLVILAWRLLLR